MVTINSNGSAIAKLPTSVNEIITNDYLINATKNITVAKNWVLIGVIFSDKISRLASVGNINYKASDDSSTKKIKSLGTVFVKAGDNTSDDFISSLRCGDQVLILSDCVNYAQDVPVPNNVIGLNHFFQVLKDNNAYEIASKIADEAIFVEYKILPICDIHCKINVNTTNDFNNPFEC